MTIECAYSIRGSGQTIVMVHGIGSHMHGWSRVVDQLERDYQCVTFDLRGHGVSTSSKGRFELDDLVDDLVALTGRLKLTEFHLVGHSLGAMVAAAYAHKFPHRVLSLGMFSTAAFRDENDKQNIRGVVSRIKTEGLADSLSGLVERWFTEKFMETEPDFVKSRKEQLIAMDQSVLLNVFEIYSENEMAPWLNEIKIPTLIVTGEFDPGCSPRLNQKIADAIPLSRLVVLEGLKHSILIEAAAPLAAAIRDFQTSRPASMRDASHVL